VRILIITFLFFSGALSAQNSCAKALEISVQELSSIDVQVGSSFYKIKNDSVTGELIATGDFDKLIVYKSSDCSQLVVSHVLNGKGDYQPSEAQLEAGFCNCLTCVESWSRIKLKQSGYTLIEIFGGTNITVKSKKRPRKKFNLWYDKTYKKGDKIQLNDIMFVPGVALFLRSSYTDLGLLYKLLNKQADLIIEIQGHVNGPGMGNKRDFQRLSQERAKAVMEFLIKKGIDSSRLSYQGFGNTRMIFPTAKSEFRMQFNRRVEILVL